MGRKSKLTDYLPVARHGNKDSQTKEEKGNGESTIEEKRQSLCRRAGANEQQGAVFLELSPLDKLIQFDLDWRYGPCTGITRLERWQRADELGLKPPKNIKDILMAHHADAQYQLNLWSSYAI
ncbi:DNA polymerase delta subunit 4 isoform X1 [Hyla sarda]|uniref:DNA polymerase delta subunit 4 isoform X1 n=1 Tax=Hyla sarda TaxID=327740 RepID=UPI0024C32DA4|nr:DNA polymerase delta subunit 4 isoform X1 [Hyla sarda]